MMNTEIYYFSGTGNSLHIAKELQKKIKNIKLIPIVSLLGKSIIKSNADTVGFVFPTYLTTVPTPVRKFIKKLEIRSAKYIFSITTRIGTFTFANIFIAKELKKKGKTLDSSFIVNMGSNSPAGISPFADKNWTTQITKDKIKKIENKVQEKLSLITKVIIKKDKYNDKGVSFLLKILLKPLMFWLTANINKEIPFYADADCNGCGICEKVCLSKKIKIINKKPVWKKEVQCYFCYACFNFCPGQSVLIKKLYTYKNGRYFHSGIKAIDIAGQKSI